jgi:neopullulanase
MRRALLLAALFCGACADSYVAPRTDLGAAGDGGSVADDGGVIPGDDGGTPPDMIVATPCSVTFRYQPSGSTPQSVVVAGEWNAWSPSALPMQAGAQGWSASVDLPPGLHAYKLVVDGNWTLDAAQPLRKWVGDVENSAIKVTDCRAPSLRLDTKAITRAAAGQGRFTATVSLVHGQGGPGLDPASVKATLRGTPLTGVTISGDAIALDVSQLADGKHTVRVEAKDTAGRGSAPLRLVFWVESQPFEWRDALIYMVMTDRFKNGSSANDAAPTAGVDPRADWKGGDLEGVRAAIADGTFDNLGVRALWLSPFNTNPQGAFLADDGVHNVVGYHGYWPIKAREVDARLGGAAALKALVAEAHAHGIRILSDFVVNHVHQQHEYVTQHADWFRSGCVCGGNNCDWTTHRLDCQFTSYLPDVNWSKPEVVEQYADDAVWWIDEFDLDGFRVDAVKHVEDVAVYNLTARLRETFEAAGTRVFLTGETAMGWNDCGLACNANEYGTINRYLGPFGLDGQADFVLYHAVPNRVFAYDDKGMIHVDYWTQQSQSQYTAGAIMTPYIGSHDTARFVSYASYRGQDPSHDRGIPGNKWNDVASAPPNSEPYARHRLALAWLLTAPGAPLLYYGDEYGEWGGADPNNRAMWRGTATLSSDESTTLTRTRALGTARRELTALRRGTYHSLLSTEDVLVFARKSGTDVAIVALSRAATAQSPQVTLPPSLGLANGTTLKDRLGGANVTAASQITITLPARGAAIYAP